MTAVAADPQKLRELDLGTARAWMTYVEQLSDLTGAEYERVEPECWASLQRELRRLERQRKLLAHATA